MPTYQYACTECGERLEAVQSFTDPALTVCPNCQGKLRKVFNSVGIVFKGSGFYRNDSREAAKTTDKANGTAADSSAPAASSSDSSKSDSAKTSSDTKSTPAKSSDSSSSGSSTPKTPAATS